MADHAPDIFTMFSNFNKSKIEGKEGEYWAKAEWPVEQIKAFAKWAVNDAKKVENMKGEECVVVAQKLLPRTAKESGNEFFLCVTSDPKPKKKEEDKAAWDF